MNSRKADVRAKNVNGDVALHLASVKTNEFVERILDFLIQFDPTSVNLKNKLGQTPFRNAIENGKFVNAKKLITGKISIFSLFLCLNRTR